MGLIALFVVILVIQAVCLTEAFASGQGGALVQLAASRPTMYLAASENIPRPPPTLITSNVSFMQPALLQIPQAQAPSWMSPY